VSHAATRLLMALTLRELDVIRERRGNLLRRLHTA
jgi:hypothetical protein